MAANIQIDHPNNIDTIFSLLESSDIHVVEDIRRLILDNLSSGRESWLIHTLVDYYYVTHSARIEEILSEVREPQDKPLLDKLQDGLKTKEQQLPSLQILLHIVYKQPPWTHRIVDSPIITVLLKCLKNAVDIPVLMTAVMIVTMLLPVVPVNIGRYLQEIFDIFLRLSAFSIKKPANTPDIFLLHLQVSLYSLLHRLYGMYPSNFLTYLHQQYKKKDNAVVFKEVVLPMLERVRLHPFLISGTREQETSTSRWKRKETQDVVVECAKLSLDLLEGTWEELQCPVFLQSVAQDRVQQNLRRPSLSQTRDETDALYVARGLDNLMDSVNVQNPDIFLKHSPSVLIGLSTPPQSQRNTPANSFLDISSSSVPQSLFNTAGNTPLLTPNETTPRDTPTIVDNPERTYSRNSNQSLLHKSDSKRPGWSGSSSKAPPNLPDIKITPGSQPSSVPPSPLKPEFTCEPPNSAVKTQPIRRAVRELVFDRIPEDFNDQVQAENKQEVEIAKEAESMSVSEQDQTELDSSGNVVDGGCPCESTTKTVGDERNVSDSWPEKVSIGTLDHVMQELADNNEDSELDDPEVTEINRENLVKNDSSSDEEASEMAHLTADSVKQFMTKVNRIRFNSLTNNGNSHLSSKKKSFSISRSSSCPLFKLENEVKEQNESASRCASTNLSQSEGTVNTVSPEEPPVETQEAAVEVVSETDSGVEQTASSGAVVVPSPPEPNNVLSITDVLQSLVSPVRVTVCQNCRNQMLMQERTGKQSLLFPQGPEVPLFSSLSPMELLDRHLRMGSELHTKELGKIPLTSKDNIHWTHFGGVPPVDEVNILRGQVLLLHNQLQYERHKRDLHARRNRRLLGKIANAVALEEQNKAMSEDLQTLKGKIQNMEVSLRLLQDENQSLRQTKDSNEYEKLMQFKVTMKANTDLEVSNTNLKHLLITQREDHDKLKAMVQSTEHKLFEKERQVEKLKEAVNRTNTLQEHVFQQQKEILLLGELQQKYEERISHLKHQQHVLPESDGFVTTLKSEIKCLKSQMDEKTMLLDVSQRKMSDFEETLKEQETSLSEMKTKLGTVKSTHEQELKATEAKYMMSVRLNQEYESKILELHTQIDQLHQQLKVRKRPDKRPASNLHESKPQLAERAQSVPPNSDKFLFPSKTEEWVESSGDKTTASYKDSFVSNTSRSQHPRSLPEETVVSSDSLSLASQEVGIEGRGKSIISTDSEDSQSVTSKSTHTSDSGVWERSLKS